MPFWSLERIKNRGNEFPTRERIKNQQKMLSQDWEDRKMWKIIFPKLGKIKKRCRLHFPPLGKSKTPKNTRRRPTKYRKHWKMVIVSRRNAENAENHLSSTVETEKMVKISFPPRRTNQKRRNFNFWARPKPHYLLILMHGREKY